MKTKYIKIVIIGVLLLVILIPAFNTFVLPSLLQKQAEQRLAESVKITTSEKLENYLLIPNSQSFKLESNKNFNLYFLEMNLENKIYKVVLIYEKQEKKSTFFCYQNDNQNCRISGYFQDDQNEIGGYIKPVDKGETSFKIKVNWKEQSKENFEERIRFIKPV